MSNIGQLAMHQTPACHNTKKHIFTIYISVGQIMKNQYHRIAGAQPVVNKPYNTQ
jgi:hypothetical protein